MPQSQTANAVSWLLQTAMFSIIFLMILVSPTPFRDFSDPTLIILAERGNVFVQVTFAITGALAALLVLTTRASLISTLMRPIYLLTLAWMLLTAMLSGYPDLALKRFFFAAIIILMAGSALTLPASLSHLARLLAWLSLATLGLCYFGVTVLPDVAIHSSQEIIEPQLAGLWRGVFQHKNVASPIMVIFIFIGLFVVRAASARLGWAIVLLALGFLAGAGGKTAIALALPVLALAQICFAMDGKPLRRAGVAIGLLVVLNFATIGLAYFTSVRSLNEALLPDATFSGRVDVWRFAIESIQRKPLTGYGFAAFWRSDEILSSENPDFDDASPFGGVPVWIKSITHAHNGFVEIAVTTGIPGLILILGWIVVAPLIDYGRVRRGGPEQALAQLFFRIWLFGIYFSSLEGVMFNRAHPVWFLMLFSVFGLYMLSRFNLRERESVRMTA